MSQIDEALAPSYAAISQEPCSVRGVLESIAGFPEGGRYSFSCSLRGWRPVGGDPVAGMLVAWGVCSADELDALLADGPDEETVVELAVRRSRSIPGLGREPTPFDVELLEIVANPGERDDDDELWSASLELDDDEACEPPVADRVLRRAYALSAVVARAQMEVDGGPAADRSRRQLVGWLGTRPGLLDEMEETELAVVMTPIGQLERQTVIDGSWRAEGVEVLAWALGVCELPAHDELCAPELTADRLGFLAAEAPAPVRAPTLRSDAELAWMGRRLLGLHWRLRDFMLTGNSVDFVAFADDCWFGSFELDGISLRDRDLAIGGRAIARASRDAVGRTASIAAERHRAINWLFGHHQLYSGVTTDT